MYAGKIIEIGDKREIFYTPQHPYTKGLLNSVPRLDLNEEELQPIEGTPPDLFSPPKGCPFHSKMSVCNGGLRSGLSGNNSNYRRPMQSTAGCRMNVQN